MSFDIDYLVLAPALIPALGAVLILVIDAIRPHLVRVHWWLAVATLLAAVMATAPGLRPESTQRGTLCLADTTCLYSADRLTLVLQVSVLVSAAVIALLAIPIPAPKEHVAVTVSMLLASTAGAAGVAAARDLGSWLVLLELATLPTVALVALRARRSSLDGALSLLMTSLVSFALLAVGAAFWFASSGSPLLAGDAVITAAGQPETRRVLIVGVVFLVAGLGFKLSLVPFHAWTPEAYSGASIPIAGFLAVTSKLAALGALLAMLRGLTVLGAPALAAIGVLAALSMTVGNLLALREGNTLRLLAWSTIAQAGWIVLPLATLASGAVKAATGYLLITSIGTLVVFAGLTMVAHAEGRENVRELSSLKGLFRRRPIAAAAIGFGLLTLAGLPPAVVGLLAKVLALRSVVAGDLWWLAIIAALNAMLGVAVYLRVVLAMAGNSPSDAVTDRPSAVHAGVVAVGLLALVIVSLAPQTLLALLG
ncbi:NADH-quinone oxidoreductase subunit N [Demetria terragena]|uniref:NADH-quinone oxidoreductase subunit N n=1 Tax=Demetria terragena TaxID=63959 RepID=UPI0003815F99|nr:proton-conducting transporter membrane subunit [Demetria terragena]